MIEFIGILVLGVVLALMRHQNKTHYQGACKSRTECERKLVELGKQRYAGTNQS